MTLQDDKREGVMQRERERERERERHKFLREI